MNTTRTRFAPSPTGYLHIGGVRTALFNWLLARQQRGQFILRIDDTDQQRNVEEALAPILHGFRWLGLEWDEGPEVGGEFGPYFQSQRGAFYQEAVETLLAKGAAYRDFAKPEELQAEREAAQAEGRAMVYSRRWRAESQADVERFEGEGRQGVVRLLMPREGALKLNDLIRGEVVFEWAREQDHVIQRADGSCLYHLATAVDDHHMQISHVVRAEEHLSNTPRQAFIAQQLGYALPEFAHLPVVAEPGSKNKLSKRKLDKYLKNKEFSQLNQHGQAIAEKLGMSIEADTFNPVIVDFYERVGYLPDAVLNYLLLLGWSLDGSREEFSRDEMIEHFSLERVNKAPASFDPQKLVAFQDRAMQKFPRKQKVARVVRFLQDAGWVADPPSCDTGPYVQAILEAAGDRIKVFGDILDYGDFFVDDEQLPRDEKVMKKRLENAEGAPALLQRYRDELAQIDDFSAGEVETQLRRFVEQEGIKMGQIVHAIRVGVTGKGVGFGLFETIAILGKERSLRRIDLCLQALSS